MRGYGHVARECASDPGLNKGKGKGKAKRDNSHSKGKNDTKPKGKAKGKGSVPYCWRCHKEGHAAHQCRAPEPR